VPFSVLVVAFTIKPIGEQGYGGLCGLDLGCIGRSGYFAFVCESHATLCTSPHLFVQPCLLPTSY
jgi:hypothetical protein